MKLKTIIQINEWISHAPAVNRNPDDQLRPTPGGFNDKAPSWDGIVEGNDWFLHIEANNWDARQAGASVYISEDSEPIRMWAKIKTHGLRKPHDTNESYKERVRKHMDKVGRSWVSAAKKIHNNPDLNEVGNPVPITWKQAFREALNDPKVKAHLADCGERRMTPIVDPVNFTPTIGEQGQTNPQISYSAVVLEDADQKKLISQLKDLIPSGWRMIAHHMTVKMGELPPDKKQDVGTKVPLQATAIGKSDKAVAVKVDGYWSQNKIPHITLAVNTAAGGKPVDSNKIIHWKQLEQNITLRGTVMEVPASSKV